MKLIIIVFVSFVKAQDTEIVIRNCLLPIFGICDDAFTDLKTIRQYDDAHRDVAWLKTMNMMKVEYVCNKVRMCHLQTQAAICEGVSVDDVKSSTVYGLFKQGIMKLLDLKNHPQCGQAHKGI